MTARSSAKSRISNIEKVVHRMPLALSSVVRHITKSITKLKRSADITQPCLTPVIISKL